MNVLQKFEAKELAKLQEGRNIPDFSAGDTLKVSVKVIEGTRERIQVYEGVCIARHGADINASFTVRKISYNEGVERVFPLYSPRIEGIEVVRKGAVRRAKLYYLRSRRGKSARISERITGHGIEARVAKAKKAPVKKAKAKTGTAKKPASKK